MKTRNRSGYEFFGFNRSDVLKVIMAPITSYSDPIVAKKSLNQKSTPDLDPILMKLDSIRDRNAGPTSTLQIKKSKIARNEAIHEAVNFGSFNDVESKT